MADGAEVGGDVRGETEVDEAAVGDWAVWGDERSAVGGGGGGGGGYDGEFCGEGAGCHYGRLVVLLDGGDMRLRGLIWV